MVGYVDLEDEYTDLDESYYDEVIPIVEFEELPTSAKKKVLKEIEEEFCSNESEEELLKD